MDRASVEERVIRFRAGALLEGCLCVPPGARGLVVLAHSEPGSRFSPRNRYLARMLRDVGLGTLLLDLVSDQEPAGCLRWDVTQLGERLHEAIAWLGRDRLTRRLPVTLFGVGTAGSSALLAAAMARRPLAGVVARSGRPDLVAEALPLITAPVLLVVGEQEEELYALHHRALERLRCPRRLVFVPRARLFKEAGVAETLALVTRRWLLGCLGHEEIGPLPALELPELQAA